MYDPYYKNEKNYTLYLQKRLYEAEEKIKKITREKAEIEKEYCDMQYNITKLYMKYNEIEREEKKNQLRKHKIKHANHLKKSALNHMAKGSLSSLTASTIHTNENYSEMNDETIKKTSEIKKLLLELYENVNEINNNFTGQRHIHELLIKSKSNIDHIIEIMNEQNESSIHNLSQSLHKLIISMEPVIQNKIHHRSRNDRMNANETSS